MPCLPQRATSWGTSIILQDEESWGQLATPGSQTALGIDFISETLRNGVVRHEDTSVGSRSISTLIDGSHDPRGDIIGELQPDGPWPLLLRHAFGGTVETSGSGPYTHVLTPGDELPVGLSVEKRFQFRNGNKKRLRYYGGRLDQFHIRAGNEGMVTARAAMIFREEYLADDDMDPAPDYIESRSFNGLNGSLLATAGTVTSLATVTSIELQLDNNLQDEERTIEEGPYRAGLPWGIRNVTGAMRAFFTEDNWGFYQDYLANETLGLQFSLAWAGLSWTFVLPAIKLQGIPTPQRSGRGPLSLDLPFTAIGDSEITVTIVNNDSDVSSAA